MNKMDSKVKKRFQRENIDLHMIKKDKFRYKKSDKNYLLDQHLSLQKLSNFNRLQTQGHERNENSKMGTLNSRAISNLFKSDKKSLNNVAKVKLIKSHSRNKIDTLASYYLIGSTTLLKTSMDLHIYYL